MYLLESEDTAVDVAAPLDDGADEVLLFPLSLTQQRLWILDRMEPGSALYNVPAAWRLRGALDVPALERALGEVVARHESLRTVFRVVDGEPVQVVLPAPPVALPVADLSALAPAAREAEAQRRMHTSAQGLFDLERGPLFRAQLLRVDSDEAVLLICMHHMVCDGWSMGVLFGEIAALYGAFARGMESPLGDLPLQYGDYAVWQREQLSGERLERHVDWWGEHLAGAPTLLELPTDRPRPAVQSYSGALHRFRLSATLAADVEALARREGATSYMVFLAALHLLLARYSRQDDVVVGSPIANRGRPELEGLIGFFVNTIAIRGDLSGEPTFRELVARVRDSALSAYAHQEVPFEKLVEELQPRRSLSHNPIFQVCFTLLDESAEALSLPGLRVEPVEQDGATAKFDVSLVLHPLGDGMEGIIEYATDLFDAATAERMAGHLAALIEAVVAAPGRRVSGLSLVPADERAQVLGAWSGAGDTFPADGTLHARFESAARARPTATAVTCGDDALTYAELNTRANRLARRLRTLGVGAESRVGLCAERSAELMVGILAILKAGGAYVPLDPSYPIERLAYMAEDSAVRVVLAQAHLLDRVPVDGLSIVALEEDLSDESGEDLGVTLDSENLAYVIYTSGSTGRPKGVGVTHANVLRLFSSTEKWFSFSERDVWTLFHSYAFDFSVWEMWGALLHGGRLVVVPWDVSRDPHAFRALLARERVTSLSQTPSAFRALAQADERAAEPLDALRFVVFGGEALQFESLRGWLDRYGPARPRLVNMYGITETTVHVTYHAVTGKELRKPGLGSAIGVPIPDLRTFVLDAAGQPLPVGVPGELCVGGAGPARGYLGRPALTAERFIPDAFSGVPGARLYRSGDLARWMADGTLEYLGRIDQQVKVRGFRIELGEIEAALLAHPSVAQTAVIVRGDGDDAALAAYVVPTAGSVDAPALKDALRQHLPEYMVPAAFVAMDRLPLTSNGKLDRRALPEPGAAGAVDAGTHAAPRTPTEELLAGIWAEVLRLEHVGAESDFFELGGHSLRATQVMARVQEAFGVTIPLRALFEGPTVHALAARIDAARDEDAPAVAPIVPVGRGRPLPLSFAQQRLWFIDRMRPGLPWYNVGIGARLRGALDVPALERALGEIVRRHETLRTVFSVDGDAPVQHVLPFAPPALERAELGDVATGEREDAVDRWMTVTADHPFDLARGPLFRASLLRVADDDHTLVLSMHHVVSDGWSTGVLFRELGALYDAFRRGEPSPLPELAVQYADYAAWQREQLSGERLDAQIAWWRRELAGANTRLELPADRPPPPVQGFRGGVETFAVDEETGAAVRALARREGATLFMALLAAFQVYLSRASGQADLLVGTPIAGRTRREVEPLIGFFVNTLALRLDLSDDPTFSTVLARVREASLGAYAHQDLPFERLVEELKVERDLSRSPLVQVMFALRDAGEGALALPGLQAEVVGAGTGTVRQDLMLTMVDEGAGFTGLLEYAADRFDPETAARMAAHFRVLLAAAAADPAARVSTLPLMDDAERRQVVGGWNATDVAYADAGATLPALLERQAARTPDAPALVCEGQAHTYAELNARVNRLARHLRRLGVGAECRVGICAERSAELVVALLAVLKAGGAYVPLDPTHPAERLAWMVADSGISLVLAQDRLAALLPSTVPLVRLDGERCDEDGSNLGIAIDPDQLAYVIYTSGSTGRPKGAMNAHRGIVNRLLWMQEAYGLGADDAVLQKTPFGFDVSVWEFFWPLLTGARLVMARPGGHRDPSYLAEVIERERITTCHFVPSMLSAFLDGVAAGRCPGLRRVVCSGEALPPSLVGRFFAAFPHVGLHNLYGPTEAAVDVTAWACAPADAAGTVPIGRPIANTRAYVLDARGMPVPAGMSGELFLGGVQVGRGYLGRPALTAERFVPDPFSGPGARMYRTGDLARWKCESTKVRRCESGPEAGADTFALSHSRTFALEYLGRTDFQVKLRGLRIELGEIEAALLEQARVKEAAVVVRGAGESAALAAYVVPMDGALDVATLRQGLQRRLPEYMVPAAIVVLERFPLGTNGKLDRAALPAPEPSARGEALVAPGTALERTLAAVWRDVLGVEEVGARDNFFALGGHSLLLARVHRRLVERFPSLTLLELFEHSTIRALAAHLGDGGGDNGGGDAGLGEGQERATLRNDLRARRQQQMQRRQLASVSRE
jgi:amino acid adenylation domain-containing protein